MTDIERGYLDTTYLDGPYTGGEIDAHLGMQLTQIVNTQSSYGVQAQQVIAPSSAYGMQLHATVDTSYQVGLQINAIINAVTAYSLQTEFVINSSPFDGMQVNMLIATAKALGLSANQITSDAASLGLQIEGHLSSLAASGMSVKEDTLRHALLGVYLEDGYLEESYLVDSMGAYLGMQVEQINKVQEPTGMQVELTVNAALTPGVQVLGIINAVHGEYSYAPGRGFQVDQVYQGTLGMQATLVIYNTSQLRIMTSFPSRGAESLLGDNWVASSQYPGDYSPNNVNTDIIEQKYRSAPGTTGLVTLTCDTGFPQGVPIDTLAILGHNFTTSAIVEVQGSQDNFATPASVVFNMVVERDNMYYIAPTLPPAAGQNRYWRFIIQDPTNSADYLEIGSIVFGAASIFSVQTCFTQPVIKGFKHFKDTIPSEGFTTVGNDRALKKYIKLNFENINYAGGDFAIIDNMLNEARTSLKVLVIPIPQYSSRFAVFGKLAQMPELSFVDNGRDAAYVSFDLEWDESL